MGQRKGQKYISAWKFSFCAERRFRGSERMRLNSPPPSSLPSSPLLSSPSPSGGQRRLLLLLHEYIKTHSLSSSLPPGAARRRSSTSSRSSALLLLQVPRRQATWHTLACTERPCYLDPSWRAASRCPALNLASVPQTVRIPNSHCKYAYVRTCTRARTLSLSLFATCFPLMAPIFHPLPRAEVAEA